MRGNGGGGGKESCYSVKIEDNIHFNFSCTIFLGSRLFQPIASVARKCL